MSMGIGVKYLRLFIVCFLLGIAILFSGTLAAIGYIAMTGWSGAAKHPLFGGILLVIAGGVCAGLITFLVRKIRKAFREIKR